MVRLLSGVALGAAALAAIWFLPSWALIPVACLVAFLATGEFLRLVSPERVTTSAAYVFVLTIVIFVGFFDRWIRSIDLWTLAFLLAIPALDVAIAVLAGRPIEEEALGVVPALYIGMPLGLLVAIHESQGRLAVLLLLGTIVLSDSSQYYTGRLIGRRPLAPTISPKKTIEGALGGLVGGTLFMVYAGAAIFSSANGVVLALTGVTVVVFGIVGDLFESKLKRAAGVKDSSALIPGHGGVLDRIDALLVATPMYCQLLRFLK
jgi:phosphatidate cytidylyltransferase